MMTDTARGGARWRWGMWGAAAGLLLAPWVAMRFTTSVAWDGADFLVFGAMLAVACGLYELAVRRSGRRAYRAAAALAIGAGFLLVWANLAVGILGDEDNPANLLFFGVLALGGAGALRARFRARGLARTLVAMAAAQALVGVGAFAAGLGATPVLTPAYVAVWLAAAALFRKAAGEAR